MDFPGSIVVSYRGSWVSAGPVTPWAGEWRLEFEHGEITWTSPGNNFGSDVIAIQPRHGDARNAPLPVIENTGPLGTLTEFAAAIREGREAETSGRDNLGTLALMLAAVESATRREPVTLYGPTTSMGVAAAI
jgi:predicted dehydrogenase